MKIAGKSAALALLVWILLTADAWPQRLIHVTDPDGNGIEIVTSAIAKLRPHPHKGCLIYLINSTQHVKESCADVKKLIEGGHR